MFSKSVAFLLKFLTDAAQIPVSILGKMFKINLLPLNSFNVLVRGPILISAMAPALDYGLRTLTALQAFCRSSRVGSKTPATRRCGIITASIDTSCSMRVLTAKAYQVPLQTLLSVLPSIVESSSSMCYLSGVAGDTMHMARLWNTGLDKMPGQGKKGYSLAALTSTLCADKAEKTSMKVTRPMRWMSGECGCNVCLGYIRCV